MSRNSESALKVRFSFSYFKENKIDEVPNTNKQIRNLIILNFPKLLFIILVTTNAMKLFYLFV